MGTMRARAGHARRRDLCPLARCARRLSAHDHRPARALGRGDARCGLPRRPRRRRRVAARSPMPKRGTTSGASPPRFSTLRPFAEHPLLILSGNEIEHALLGYAAMLIGVPHAPVSPNYSLVSKDFAKLKHVVGAARARPGLRQRRRALRHGHRRRDPRDHAAGRAQEPDRGARPVRRARRDRAVTGGRRGQRDASRPTPSQSSSSPPARPACPRR